MYTQNVKIHEQILQTKALHDCMKPVVRTLCVCVVWLQWTLPECPHQRRRSQDWTRGVFLRSPHPLLHLLRCLRQRWSCSRCRTGRAAIYRGAAWAATDERERTCWLRVPSLSLTVHSAGCWGKQGLRFNKAWDAHRHLQQSLPTPSLQTSKPMQDSGGATMPAAKWSRFKLHDLAIVNLSGRKFNPLVEFKTVKFDWILHQNTKLVDLLVSNKNHPKLLL